MSLAEFLATTQAEIKGRVEDECRKHIHNLLEESFSKKWDEYVSKVIASANATPLYSADYGRLDISSIPETVDFTAEVKNCLKSKLATYKFPSESVYIIHFCVKMNYGYSYSKTMDVQFIDNYGFCHGASGTVTVSNYGQPINTINDTTKPIEKEQYIYPLSNALIDIVKSIPYTVDARRSEGSYANGGDFQGVLQVVASLRKITPHFSEYAFVIDALKKENEMLKAQLAAITAAAPAKNEEPKTDT